MNAKTATLSFADVSVGAAHDYDAALDGVTFRVAAGDFLLVLAEKQAPRLPLADLAEGLVAPESGRVEFQGESWPDMSPDRAVACRARIGRVFREAAWVSNLDVDENVTLRERHFTRRPVEEIEAEALALARAFGMDDLPRKRPPWTARYDLARSQWVRALLGQPDLLLLESPETDVPDEGLAALRTAVAQARTRGAAIVWFTSDPRLWNDRGLKISGRCEMRGARMVRGEDQPG